MITRTQIKQEFLANVDACADFHRRKDGKIERAVYRDYEPNTKVVKGEYYAEVEIMTNASFLKFIDDLVTYEHNKQKHNSAIESIE